MWKKENKITGESDEQVVRSLWIVVRPNPLELVEVVSPQHSPVSGQIFKVVHDDGNEQVDDLWGRGGVEGGETETPREREK